MTYKTILTIKGTTTIPKEIRDSLGIKPGMLVEFTKDQSTGAYTIKRARTISEIRKLNKEALIKANRRYKDYQGGDGYNAHMMDKFQQNA